MELETGQSTVIEIKKDNVKELAQVLKTVVFKDVSTLIDSFLSNVNSLFQFGMLYAYDSGLKITVDDGAYQQANAFLKPPFFSDFKVREDNISLKLPLKTIYVCFRCDSYNLISLQEFLSIPEGYTNSVKLSYSGMFDPLKLLIEEGDGCVIRGKFNSSIADQVN